MKQEKKIRQLRIRLLNRIRMKLWMKTRILQMTVQTVRKLTVLQTHRIPIQKIHPRRGQNNHDH